MNAGQGRGKRVPATVVPLVLWLATLAVAGFVPARAQAEFTAAKLVSGTAQIPFEAARDPALSADGNYIVFQGELAGVSGIYRRDLRTGEVEPVAVAEPAYATISGEPADAAVSAPDAAAPSISADGRYVAFTSAAVLDPAQDEPVQATSKGCPQVYVRDMARRPDEAGAYTLASALDGSDSGLSYAAPCASAGSGQLAVGGSQAAPGVALSADGQQVAFTILSASDLTGACTTTPPGSCPTPASQVAVRHLATQTTTLVSVTPDGRPTPGGGAFPSTASEQLGGLAIGGSESVFGAQPSGSTAAISADGSTVAWLGTDIPEQVPSASDVTAGMAGLGGPAFEVEPLWRRVADGTGAVTRRLMNDVGLNFYLAQQKLEQPMPVAGGTLVSTESAFVPPALSSDGRTVATIANAPSTANEGSLAFVHEGTPPPTEAYTIHVDDDLNTAPQVTPLTATPDFAVQRATRNQIKDLTISPDGSRVAFNTPRVSFALAPPTLISPPTPEVSSSYTYEANLQLGTLQRVTTTYDGSPPNGEPELISFAGNGLSLAFASAARNLIYGDGVTGSEVYISEELPSGIQAAPEIGPLPAAPTPGLEWMLNATAVAKSDGSVIVHAGVPGAGRLSIAAAAQLPAPSQGQAGRVRSGHPARSKGKSGTASRRGKIGESGRESKGKAKLLTLTVAQTGTVVGGPAEIQLRVQVRKLYRAQVASRSGLYAVLRITFTAPGHAPLTRGIPVTFRRSVHRRAKVRVAR